jgi:hypothetical protein
MGISYNMSYKMHKMHNNSLRHGHLKAIGNTFFVFFEIIVAILKLLYYNGKDFNSEYY